MNYVYPAVFYEEEDKISVIHMQIKKVQSLNHFNRLYTFLTRGY